MRKVNRQSYEARRRQILKAARACFTRSGFRGAGMKQICAEAGMSPGNLYHYFAGKEAIIEALCEEHRLEVMGRFRAMEGRGDFFQAMLGYAGEAMGRRVDLQHRRFTAEMQAEALRNPRVRAIVRRHNAALLAMGAAAIAQAQALGQVDPALDPKLAAALLVGAADGLRLQLALARGLDAEASGRLFTSLVTRFLRPGADASAGRVD